MATTTVLTTATRTANAGASHAHFDLLSSTPDSGAVRAGMGFWWVYRTGNPDPIKTAQGLEFAYATRNDGDIVVGRYVDGAGVAGGDSSYTFTVTNTWDGEQFVKGAGNNGNAGTSDGVAVQTLVQAITNTRAAWSSGDDRAINLNAGETFAVTGAAAPALWATSLTGHICIRKYGSGANPIITLADSGNGAQLFAGDVGINAITLIDVTIQAGYTMGGSTSDSCVVNCTSLNASRTSASILFIGVDASGLGTFIVGPTGSTLSDRALIDFVALADGSLDVYMGGTATLGGHGFIGFDYMRRLLCQDWTWGRTNAANGFVRGTGWTQVVFDNVLFDRQSTGNQTNTLRFNGGDRTTGDDYAHRITLHNVRWRRCGEGVEFEPVTANEDGFRDIDLIACSADFTGSSSLGAMVRCVETTGNPPFLDGLRILNCWSRQNERVPMVQINAGATGSIDNVRIAHCNVVGELDGEFFTDNCILLTQGGAGTADGAITLLNNYGYSLATGTGGGTPVALFQVSATAKINAASDNNKMRKSAGTVNFCSDGGSSRSLASWQGVSAADDQSSVDTGTSNLTSTSSGADGTFDARPASGTGPQIDFGLAGVLYADGDGNLYAGTTPDAGAFQDGGTPVTEPSIGSSTSRRLINCSLAGASPLFGSLV